MYEGSPLKAQRVFCAVCFTSFALVSSSRAAKVERTITGWALVNNFHLQLGEHASPDSPACVSDCCLWQSLSERHCVGCVFERLLIGSALT